ncbi:MAG: hypothetical protein ACOYL3_16095 [Desulfuromonadaceae bacterium]
MPKYLVKEPLNHDQKEYAPGATVEMSAEQADALLAVGVVETPPSKTTAKDQTA